MDFLEGEDGADIFVFTTGDGLDTIKDFEIGIDSIDLSGTGLAFIDLVIAQVGSRVTVEYGDDTIVLLGTTDTDMTEDQFILM